MKKRSEKLIAIILCLIMCVSLCACGTQLNALLVLKKCADAVSKADSISFDMHADAKANLNKLSTEMETDGECVWVKEPFAVKADINASFGKNSSIALPAIFTREEDSLVMYMQLNVFGKPVWLRSELGKTGSEKKFNISDAAKLFENGAATVALDKNEGGSEYILNIGIPSGLVGELLSADVSGLPEICEVTVKVDKESFLPTEISMEAAPLVQSLIDRSGAENSGLIGKISVESVPVTLTLTGTDQTLSIDVPNEMCVVIDITPDKPEEPAAAETLPEAETSAAAEEPAVTEEPEAEEPESAGDAVIPGEAEESRLEELYDSVFSWFSQDENTDGQAAEGNSGMPEESETSEESELEEFYDSIFSWFASDDSSFSPTPKA